MRRQAGASVFPAILSRRTRHNPNKPAAVAAAKTGALAVWLIEGAGNPNGPSALLQWEKPFLPSRISEQVAQFPLTRAPIDGERYGVRLRALGFDENGAMRYQVLEVRDGATVPLRLRGYTLGL